MYMYIVHIFTCTCLCSVGQCGLCVLYVTPYMSIFRFSTMTLSNKTRSSSLGVVRAWLAL